MDVRRVVEHRWRTEQHPVDDPEHRRVGADPQRERDDDGGCEARLRTKSAQGVADILCKGVKHATSDTPTARSVASRKTCDERTWTSCASGLSRAYCPNPPTSVDDDCDAHCRASSCSRTN